MRRILALLLQVLLASNEVLAFAPSSSRTVRSKASSPMQLLGSRKEFLGSKATFDPIGFSTFDRDAATTTLAPPSQPGSTPSWLLPAAATAVTLFGFSDGAQAATDPATALAKMANLTPQTFVPVCPASDGFYRFLQGTTESVVGRENFVEYGPLIAGGLLRVRLELCVVESFFNEAVGPFIQENGVSWILPLHETVETFLAGTIFALASTFILVGSTKLLTVMITYADVFLGVPLRLLGGFAFDRARGKPITFDVGIGPFQTRLVGPPKPEGGEPVEEEKLVDLENSSPVSLALTIVSGGFKTVGEGSKLVREIMEALDLFVGRYLVLIATGYIGLKFLHFKVFPDFPF